jgi:hypothetical protein
MTARRKISFAATICMAGVLGSAGAPPAIAANLPAGAVLGSAAQTGIVPVSEARKHHRRRDVGAPVHPQAGRDAPGCPGLRSWNPNNPDRGYCDPGFAYHGNINGCASDLGYGRWEPCDRGGGGGGGMGH